MHRRFLVAGALLAGLAVALGAFGAHGLQKITSDAKTLQGYQTAVQYQAWHAIGLLLTGILYSGGFDNRWLKRAGYSMLTGILLFSGSLYVITLLKIRESSLTSVMGPVTPVGGLFLILGWVLLLTALLRKK